MSTLLHTLFHYHAWANVDLFDTLEKLDRESYRTELQAALRLISHYYVVSRIFAAHLECYSAHVLVRQSRRNTDPQ